MFRSPTVKHRSRIAIQAEYLLALRAIRAKTSEGLKLRNSRRIVLNYQLFGNFLLNLRRLAVVAMVYSQHRVDSDPVTHHVEPNVGEVARQLPVD